MNQLSKVCLAFVGIAVCAASSAAAGGNPGSMKLCSDLKQSKCGTTFGPAGDILVHVELDSSVADTLAAALGVTKAPKHGTYSVAISKTIDDEPIVQTLGKLSIADHGTRKTLDFALQAGDKTMLAIMDGTDTVFKDPNLGLLWNQQAQDFPEGKADWEVFLLFVADDGTPSLIAQAKFTYAMTADGRKKLRSATKDFDKKRFEKVKDDGIATGVHKANVGKIVFGKKKMKKDFDDKKALVSSVDSVAGGLYARLYLAQSMRNELADRGQAKDLEYAWWQLTIAVDGGITRTVDDSLTRDEADALTSLSLTLVPGSAADVADMPAITKKFVYVVSTLAPGKHKIKLTATLRDAELEQVELASAVIELDVTKKDRDKAAKAYGAKLDARGLLDDKKLAKAAKKAYQPKGVVALRMPLAWEERRDAAGAVTHRVAPLIRGYKDAGECQVEIMMIAQDRDGGKWTTLGLSSEKVPYGVDPDLPCQNLEK